MCQLDLRFQVLHNVEYFEDTLNTKNINSNFKVSGFIKKVQFVSLYKLEPFETQENLYVAVVFQQQNYESDKINKNNKMKNVPSSL